MITASARPVPADSQLFSEPGFPMGPQFATATKGMFIR
jgi:hypothetical protein